jgi:hypothetical protein
MMTGEPGPLWGMARNLPGLSPIHPRQALWYCPLYSPGPLAPQCANVSEVSGFLVKQWWDFWFLTWIVLEVKSFKCISSAKHGLIDLALNVFKCTKGGQVPNRFSWCPPFTHQHGPSLCTGVVWEKMTHGSPLWTQHRTTLSWVDL